MNKFLKRLIFLPVWALILLTVISAACLTSVFVNGLEKSCFAYLSYAASFYTLTAVCVFFCLVFPKKYRILKQKIYSNPITKRYITDVAFRTRISLYASFAVNLLYVGINVIFFAFYRSAWFVVLATYYAILGTVRFLLLYSSHKNSVENRLGELKSAVVCSSILLTVNFVLSGAVLMILYQNKGFEYNGIFIYVMALYTFYITTHAIVSLVKYRKVGNAVITMSKIITLSAALVSMLCLETAMFSQFGQGMETKDKQLMIVLTGAGVSIIVVTMSVYAMVKSLKEIKKLRGKQNGKL